MNIDAVLSGQTGLAGVQWILHGPLMQDVLQGELSALLATGNQVRSLHLRRAKFKPDRKLTAYYDVVLYDGREASVRPIAVTWTPQGKGIWQEAKPILLEMQAEICAQGLAAPFRQLMTEVTAWNMGIQIYPLDGYFPQLMRLASPQYARDMLATYNGTLSQGETSPWEGCTNPGHPMGRLCTSITPIRYRPRQRHVLRYSSVSETQWANPLRGRSSKYGAKPPGEKTIFAKLYNSEKGAQTFQVVTQVADWLERCGVGITALRPLAYVAADKTVLYPHLAGVPLSHYLQYSKGDVERYLRQAGSALRALQESSGALSAKRGLASELKVHTFAAEVKLVARASEHIQALLPAVGKKIDEILERLQELYASLPPESPTFTHKDFKADHIWVTPAGLTLIDFDSCCLADAALDVGKFLADLQWWYSMGRLGPTQPDRPAPSVEKVQACFLAGYDGGISPASQNFHLIRSRLYEVLWLVKMGARRFRLYAPGWEERTEQAIRKAEVALNMITVKEGYNEKS